MSLRSRTTEQAPPAPPGTLEGAEEGDFLLAALERLPGLDVRSWRSALGRIELAPLAAQLRFSPERYTRTLLARTDDAEALLMGWLPGQASPVHDHGVSRGMTLVLSGTVKEETFDVRGERAVPRTTRTWREGDTLYEEPGDVHRLVNPGPELLVTLHVYAPRLTEFRKYEI